MIVAFMNKRYVCDTSRCESALPGGSCRSMLCLRQQSQHQVTIQETECCCQCRDHKMTVFNIKLSFDACSSGELHSNAQQTAFDLPAAFG